MGGNACKEYDVQRVDKNTFNLISTQLKIDLDNMLEKYPTVKYNFIPSYTAKNSFGDLDVIYTTTDTTDIIQLIKEYFNPIGYIHNYVKEIYDKRKGANTLFYGDCFSFVYQYKDINFQVDMIRAEPKFYNFNLQYFSYNDLGNLLGIQFKKLGFKLSHRGLLYSIWRNGEFKEDVVVSTDWDKSLALFGFFNSRIQFNTLEDIFRYVTTGTYFHPELYPLEARNHDSRVRDRKRPTYNAFLRWLDDNKFDIKSYQYNIKNLREEIYQKAVDIFGDNFDSIVKSKIKKYEIQELIKEKFNGDTIREITGLENKELGNFIKEFKASFKDSDYTFEDYVLSNSIELIKSDIKIFDARGM